ncbi:MAG: LysR family transcriptional regulator [Pseudomonadota bacterium]
MELRHLRYFVAVAEEQSVTRAAERLGMQQPPLSQQIRDLERELGVELFERTPRSLRLNSAGQVFLHDARKLLRDAQDAVTRVRHAARGELGRLAIGYTSSAALHPQVPRVLRVFRESYPQIALDVREDATDTLFRAVVAEEIDAAFVRAPASRFLPLRSQVVGEEPVVVALPRGHRLSGATGPLPLAALAQEDFVLYRSPDGPGVLDVLAAACHRAGFTPHAVASVPRLLSAAAMVAAGRGITLLPQALQALHRDSVVYRPLDQASAFTIPLTLVWRDGPDSTPLARFVASVLPLR